MPAAEVNYYHMRRCRVVEVRVVEVERSDSYPVVALTFGVCMRLLFRRRTTLLHCLNKVRGKALIWS